MGSLNSLIKQKQGEITKLEQEISILKSAQEISDGGKIKGTVTGTDKPRVRRTRGNRSTPKKPSVSRVRKKVKAFRTYDRRRFGPMPAFIEKVIRETGKPLSCKEIASEAKFKYGAIMNPQSISTCLLSRVKGDPHSQIVKDHVERGINVYALKSWNLNPQTVLRKSTDGNQSLS